MKKIEFIAKYGEAAYERVLERSREWQKKNREKCGATKRIWILKNPVKVEASNHERERKGGKHYAKKVEYMRTGVQGARNKTRRKHRYHWKPYKDFIAPNSELHHEWIPETAEYRGLALVEAKPLSTLS